jgi:hypothetical protein
LTVLSDTFITSAIAGCVNSFSRSRTIWMRLHCMGIFPMKRCFWSPNLGLVAFDHLFLPNQMERGNHTPILKSKFKIDCT